MKMLTITLTHPDKLTKSAVVNIWFTDDGEIVLGGLGWIEYYDYEKIKKKVVE